MKVQHLKNEFKKILTRYVQYKYTFFFPEIGSHMPI